MKINPAVSSSRRKSRKRHFQAPSSERRKIMSASLDKSNREKYNIRSLPIRQGDEVVVVRGSLKGREGKVKTVYRRRYVIYVEKLTREKANGTQVPIPIHPSNVRITKIHLDRNRTELIARKGETQRRRAEKYAADDQ
jgi:ribosomal protein uL24